MFTIKVPKSLTRDARFYQYLLAKVIDLVFQETKDGDYILTKKAVQKFLDEDKEINCLSVLRYYIHTFKITDLGDEVAIGDLTGQERYAGSTKTLYDVIRIMEYGVQGYPPVPRLTKVIGKIQESLPDIYKSWEKAIRGGK